MQSRKKKHTSPNFRRGRLQKPALNCCSPWNPLLLVETPCYTNRSSGLAAPGGMLPTQLSGWYLSCLQPACDTTAEMTLVFMRSQTWSQFDCTLTSIYKQAHKEKLRNRRMEVGWSPYATSADWLSSKDIAELKPEPSQTGFCLQNTFGTYVQGFQSCF